MRIAFFMDQFPRLTETYFLDQMTGLIRDGHQVDIIATAPSGQPKVHPLVNEFQLLDKTRYMDLLTAFPLSNGKRMLKTIGLILRNLHRCPRSIFKALNYKSYGCTSLDTFLRVVHGAIALSKGRDDYDIVHCHLGPVALMGVSLRHIGLLKGKIVASFHSADAYVYPHKWTHLHIYDNLWEWMDLCTVCSNYMSNTIQHLGADPRKIRKLPVGLDFTKFTFKERKLKSSDKIKVVTVARLAEKKGLEYSIRAMAKAIQTTKKNILYQIAGEGPMRQQLEGIIEELGVGEQVKILGWCSQPEVTCLLEESHFFILPSVTAQDGNKEGQALVLQEAQAVGLPVVTTIHNGIPEGLIDGETGFLVPERDIDQMAEKILYLIHNPSCWSTMGKAGRAFVETNYDINRLNHRLVSYYEQLLNGGLLPEAQAYYEQNEAAML